MTVRVRVRHPFWGHALSGQEPAMRRVFIYPHRSIRAAPPSIARYALAAVTIAVLTLAIAITREPLLRLHNQLCLGLVELTGLPISGVSEGELFEPIGNAPVPLVAVTPISSHPVELWVLFTAAMVVLLELHRRIPFFRSFF